MSLRVCAESAGFSPQVVEVLDTLSAYSNAHTRTWPLWGDDALSLRSVVKSIQSNVKGIDNIYTQHRSALYEILQTLFAGELKTMQFPFAENGSPKTSVASQVDTERASMQRSAESFADTYRPLSSLLLLAASTVV